MNMERNEPQDVAQNWRFRAGLREAFWLTLIVLAWGKFCWGLESSMDVRGFDELGMYLQPGITLPETGLLDGAYAPLYQLWYFGLSMVTSDPVDLYYLNYKISLLLIPVCIYVLIRQCKLIPPVAFIGAFYVLNSHLPYVYPFCSHFATLVILCGAIGGMMFRQSAAKLAIMSIGLLLAAYARPEFFLAFLLVGAFLIFRLAFRVFQNRAPTEESQTQTLIQSIVPVCAMCIFTIVLIGFFGSPWSNPNPDHQGHRGFFAFGQHYALNCVERTGESTNPWANWRTFIEKDFGDAQSMKECFVANPSAFAAHTGRNFANSFLTIKEIANPNSTPIFVGIGLMIFLVLPAFKRQSDYKPDPLPDPLPDHKPAGDIRELALLLLVTFLATVPALILIYPRDHYVLPMFSICVVLLISMLANGRVAELNALKWKRYALPVVAVLAAILMTPQRADELPIELAWEKENYFVKKIRFLNEQEFVATPKILRADTGLEWMVDFPMEPIVPFKVKTPFLQFIQNRNADVVLDDYHLRNAIFEKDSEYKEFVANPAKFGFERDDIPNTPFHAYFRIGILDPNRHSVAKQRQGSNVRTR